MPWPWTKPKPPPPRVSVFVFGVGPQAETARFVPGGFMMPFYVFGLYPDGTSTGLQSIIVLFEYGNSRDDIVAKVEAAVYEAAAVCGISAENINIVIHGI